MLDQNTTTIITSALTVIGALGGVVLGVVLSNRYVARQEKAKRNAVIIEEAYTLINKVDNQISDDIYSNRPDNIMGIKDNLERARTLIYLYLPSIKHRFKDYNGKLFILMDEMRSSAGPVTDSSLSHLAIYDSDLYEKYMQGQEELMESLEKLVR